MENKLVYGSGNKKIRGKIKTKRKI